MGGWVKFGDVERGQEFRLPKKTEVRAGVRITRGTGAYAPGDVRWKKTGEQSYELVEWDEKAYSALPNPSVSLLGCRLSVSSKKVKVYVP